MLQITLFSIDGFLNPYECTVDIFQANKDYERGEKGQKS